MTVSNAEGFHSVFFQEACELISLLHHLDLHAPDFAVFQYFVNIVPTKYIDAGGRTIKTNQYSVTDYARTVTHGLGVPGIFIK